MNIFRCAANNGFGATLTPLTNIMNTPWLNMYIHEISIEIKSQADKDELIDEFFLLTSSYRSNGQTQGRIETQFIDGNKIVCLPYTLEKASLDKTYNNSYVARHINKIQELCKSKIKFRMVGQVR